MAALSVVLPVRNAVAYAADAVRSAILGCGPLNEIVVSDNHSSDGTYQLLVQEFGRVRHVSVVRPPHPLSMTAHFNFALNQASGDFISIIGADDGVMPYFSRAMSGLLASHPKADAFLAPRAYFYWPGVSDAYGDRAVLAYGRPGAQSIDARREYVRALTGRVSYADSLQMYAGSVVSRSLIQRVRNADPDGLFYRGTQPDMYSTFALLCHDPKIVRTNYPLHWTGSSPASNGYHGLRNPDGQRKSEFWELAEGSDEPTTTFFDHGRQTPVALLVVDAAVRARRVHPLNGRTELNRAEMKSALAGALARVREDQRSLVQETAARFDPPIHLSDSAMRLRKAELTLNRANRVAARLVAPTRRGFKLEVRSDVSSACPSISVADQLIRETGFAPY